MRAYLLVFLGAGLGGSLRHAVNVACGRWCGLDFPWGTLFINATGSFVMGLFAGWLAFKGGQHWTQSARLFAMTGVLGGYTTFSAFSLDAALLWERGEAAMTAAYVVSSVALAIIGLFAGLSLMRALT